MTQTTRSASPRTNRFPGSCTLCGGRVPSEQGVLSRQPSGGWVVSHDGPCPAVVAEATPAFSNVGQTCEPGVYVLPDSGEIVKVKANKANTHVYAHRWIDSGERIVDDSGERIRGDWDYAPGLIGQVRPEFRMTLDAAKAFILRYGKCVRCSRRLKAADSVERGIGPVCVRYFTFAENAGAAPAVCDRHGQPLDPTCWECNAERDGAELEAAQERAAFAAKVARDDRIARLQELVQEVSA